MCASSPFSSAHYYTPLYTHSNFTRALCVSLALSDDNRAHAISARTMHHVCRPRIRGIRECYIWKRSGPGGLKFSVLPTFSFFAFCDRVFENLSLSLSFVFFCRETSLSCFIICPRALRMDIFAIVNFFSSSSSVAEERQRRKECPEKCSRARARARDDWRERMRWYIFVVVVSFCRGDRETTMAVRL